MKLIMGLMNVAFYHERLPSKPYYNSFKGNLTSIPHGLYEPEQEDQKLSEWLAARKGEDYLLCVPGNIRMEKNYKLIIESLPKLKNCKLLIAGSPANSSVNIDELKQYAASKGVDDKIIWLTKYLTEEEFTSVLKVSDLILLYYKTSFKSQSGILNQIAPLKKNVLISDTESGLTELARRFDLGTIIMPDNKIALINGIKSANENTNYINNWNKYIKFASWEKQCTVIINTFENS
ncbi:MAG: glycosyltransferase [Chlorobi bacterium]|nr:glycosyltransferase [Chlorobiota bacterium]